MNKPNVAKKALALALAATMLGSAVPAMAAASDQADNADMKPSFSVIVDGDFVGFQDANGQYVYPVVYEGSTYLPLRAIGNLMGKEVQWDATTETVTLSGKADIKLVESADTTPDDVTVGITVKKELTVVVDGEKQTFKNANGTVVYPLNYNGSTYLPVRAIATLMGKDVGWNGAASWVVLGKPQLTEKGTTVLNYIYGLSTNMVQLGTLDDAMDDEINQTNIYNNINVLAQEIDLMNQMRTVAKPAGFENDTTVVDTALSGCITALQSKKDALERAASAYSNGNMTNALVTEINDILTQVNNTIKSNASTIYDTLDKMVEATTMEDLFK